MITFDQRMRDPFLELRDVSSYLISVMDKAIQVEMALIYLSGDEPDLLMEAQ